MVFVFEEEEEKRRRGKNCFSRPEKNKIKTLVNIMMLRKEYNYSKFTSPPLLISAVIALLNEI